MPTALEQNCYSIGSMDILVFTVYIFRSRTSKVKGNDETVKIR